MSVADQSSGSRVTRLEDYRPPEWLVDDVELNFDLDPPETVVRARLSVRRNPEATSEAPLVLDGRDLALDAVAVDGRTMEPGDYQLGDESLTLHVTGDRASVETVSRIRPADNTELEGLYQAGEMLITQCEAEGFRRITWFPDRPDVMARYRVRIAADKKRFPTLLSNGNRVEAGQLDGGRHYAVFEDPFRKPSYLFALVAGDLEALTDEHVTPDGRRVKLAIHAPAGLLDRLQFAMASLKAAMQFDERVYGLACDLDEYHVVVTHEYNQGAMENKGLNVFNAKFVLASPDTATDTDYCNVEAVVGHEYFHNWTGNRVTCRDWFQLSLKEGLTVFREQQFAEDLQGPVRRIDDVMMLRAGQFAEDGGPMAHPVRPEEYEEINNFYSLTVYEKGAEVVRMYHTLLGADGFRRGMDLYFERHDGQAVTCDDFRRAMADANDRDLEQFGLWYSQAGTPVVTVHSDWDADSGEFTLNLSQHVPPTPGQANKQPMPIPVAVGLLDGAGRELPAALKGESEPVKGTRVLELTEREQRFTFTGLDREPVPSLLRGFSAPVKLHMDRDIDTLAFLMRHDPDGFAAWDAALELKTDVLLVASDGESEPELPDALVEAARGLLSEDFDDAALVAELLRLPSLDWLFEQVDEIRVDALWHAHLSARALLADRLATEWRTAYETLSENGEYRPQPAQMGRRRLRHLCLDYLAAGGADAERVRQQFRRADNLTDRYTALRILVHDRLEGAETALEQFASEWGEDPLLRDKWFAVQATVPAPETVDRVEALMAHESFVWTNPNRVRSVVHAFARANPVGFHRADGAGYRLLADAVLRLDGINPHTAAAICRPLERWRRFEPKRRMLMHDELERLAGHKLSKATGEIVRRALSEEQG